MTERSNSPPSFAPAVLQLLLCWLVLMWPALVNDGPFLFADTTAYVRGADAGAVALTGRPTPWSAPAGEAGAEAPGTTTADAGAGNGGAEQGDRIVLAGRSVYYGALAYLSYLLSDGFWLLAAAQALVAGIATALTVVRFLPADASPIVRGLAAPAVLLCTSAPYYAGFIMPDIFTALSVLALANLAAFWREDSRTQRVFWSALLAYALLAHSANLLLAIVLAGLGLLLASVGIMRVPRGAATVVAAGILTAIAGEVAFSSVVRNMTGNPPVRPPFLTARIVDDGPGYRHLQATCPGSGYALCSILDRPPPSSDAFLWGEDRPEGAFLSGTGGEARRLSAEQGRFVLDVFMARPLDLIASSASAIGRQATMFSLSEFNYDPGTRDHLDRKLPPAQQADAQETRAYRGTMPTRVVAFLALPLSVLSLLAAGFALKDRWRSRRTLSSPAVFALAVLAGVAINVAISGAISTPHDRYNMRALWLLPVLAATLLPLRAWRAAGDRRGREPVATGRAEAL